MKDRYESVSAKATVTLDLTLVLAGGKPLDLHTLSNSIMKVLVSGQDLNEEKDLAIVNFRMTECQIELDALQAAKAGRS